MAQHQLTSSFKVDDVLTSTTATVLADQTGTYGIKTAAGVTVVSADTAMTEDSTGIYRYTYEDGGTGVVVNPVAGTSYVAYVKHTYAGQDYYSEIEFTIGAASGTYPTLTTIRQYIRELALNASELDYDNTSVDMAFKVAANEYLERLAPDFSGGNVTVTSGSSAVDFSALTGFSPTLVRGMFIDTNYPVHVRDEAWVRQQIIDNPSSGRPEYIGFSSETTGVTWPTASANYTLNVDYENVLTSWTAGTSSPDGVTINIPEAHAIKIATMGAPVVLQYGDNRSTYGRPEWSDYLDWIDTRARRRDKNKITVRDPLRARVSGARHWS